MKIWLCYVFALVAISLGDTMKTYTESDWHTSDGETAPPTILSAGQTHYLPNQSLANAYTSFQQAPKSITPLTQHFGYEKKPMELDAVPHEYIRTIVKSYPVYVNEKHSNGAFVESPSDMWPPNDMFTYQNSIEQGPTAHMPQMNHVTHLSPVGAVPQISPMASYAQLSSVKHLESQLPTVGPPSASYPPQSQASYTPMTSYSVPSVAPYEHVQTFLKPYHTSMPAVKHIESPQLNSIVSMHSVPPVTAYNSVSSHPSYAPIPSATPFEHIQTIVKPYPVYFKAEDQHPSAFIVEQPPSPPPTPPMPSNFWHPETFVYNKPTFSYHNGPDSYYPIYHPEPVHSIHPVHPVHNIYKQYPVFIKEKHPSRTFAASGSNYWSVGATAAEGTSLNNSKDSYYPIYHPEPVHSIHPVHPVHNIYKQYPVFIKEKHPSRTFAASGSNYWSVGATAAEGTSLNNSKGYVKHKNFLIKRKSIFNQR